MMMMHQKPPTVDIPPWTGSSASLLDEPGAWPVSGISGGGSSSLLLTEAALAALQQYLPSDDESSDCAAAVDAYSCDEFRMYEFKIRRCARGRSHDWTECPYAHPGEKARRRDPRKFHYSGTACPDFRKGCCKRADACEYAHGVFECWLHPARYRTQPCKDGTACRRRVCFFAHTPDQLRVLPQSPKAAAVESYDGSPMRQSQFLMGATPPMSPSGESQPPSAAVNELLSSLRKMQLEKVKSMPPTLTSSSSPTSGSPPWGFSRAGGGGFCSLPSTPTRNTSSLFSNSGWDLEEEEVAEERVESGRALRMKLYEKLSKDVVGPDVGWVAELVK
ncbi:putative zinc finger CCCH domain-containing protein 2 [Iris pallida]|uniref:Zinc finger CCCH domain-containing protein 2 n=1 Tax=Iris pallida TaxID=29817 RepID=A0AAX6HN62_IRIPA|nr:putative zinc finger CCCH domain-containing protein 2 [Iris pallida]